MGSETAVTELRRRGERVTPARRAVLEVLDETTEHLSAEQIVARAAARAPGVHRATVYRALGFLGELGLVTHTHLGGAATVHHLHRPAPHLHARCAGCGRVIDVDGDTLAGVAATLRDRYDFALDLAGVALPGRCTGCRPGPAQPVTAVMAPTARALQTGGHGRAGGSAADR